MMARSLGLALVGGFVALNAGCLVMHGSSHDESGVRVSGTTLNQITPGSTSEAWLLATLGEPTARCAVDGVPGQQILKYEHRVEHSEGGSVFLLYAGGKDYTKKSITYFEVTDGVITRYWTEKG